MAFPAINDFKRHLLDGGQRPSLFQMELRFPIGIFGGAQGQNVSRFHIRIAEIPPALMNPIVVKYAGREVKYATQRQYQPITVTLLNDEGFTVRRGLELWFNSMNLPEGNVAQRTSNRAGDLTASYATTADIIQYSKTGAPIRTYKLVDIFPSNIGAIQLSWDNEAAIGEYTCEFQYQYWSVAGEDDYVPRGIV